MLSFLKKISFFKELILLIFISFFVISLVGCEHSNMQKIAIIKEKQQITNNKIEKKHKNNLIIPDILKKDKIAIDEDDYVV